MYIYQGIIQPRFDYALTIWEFTSQYNLSKVQRLQNRAARIITGEFDYIHVRGIDIVKNLKWMNLIQRRDYFVALSMFKCIHGMSPSYLSDCITMYNEIKGVDADTKVGGTPYMSTQREVLEGQTGSHRAKRANFGRGVRGSSPGKFKKPTWQMVQSTLFLSYICEYY